MFNWDLIVQEGFGLQQQSDDRTRGVVDRNSIRIFELNCCPDEPKKQFVSSLTNSGICVKINNLQVPEVIRHGSPVVLDCDFSLEPLGDDELVVKWYKNKTLVYQWIPARRPVGLGILKGRLNLAYAASEQNYSVHRALHILKSGPDLSGEYTCSVSTLKNEDERTKTMLVFGKRLRLF
ncbi:hypothetical protein QE152_g35938 [Popillia japonica]|uniref:Ig-like domain-containing protein n=1 Tax=Popillia japonica TaxID=7064 RepID=A0AAW1IE95_POPJA